MVGVALLLAATLSAPGPFVLVNGIGAAVENVSVKPAITTGNWRPLAGSGLSPGARRSLPSPGGDLCAFDLRAKVGGEELTWSSVNLCDVRIVTLKRNPDGTLWVDYD